MQEKIFWGRSKTFIISQVHFGERGNTGYINFVTNISPDCDCTNWTDAPIVRDIGAVAWKVRLMLKISSGRFGPALIGHIS
jgi:uncharacterized Fe-S center protein